MTSGWLAFAVATITFLCVGAAFAAAVVRAAWERREREALSPTDLIALEESAVVLVEQIRTEGDRAVAEIDRRSRELRELLREAEAKGILGRTASSGFPPTR